MPRTIVEANNSSQEKKLYALVGTTDMQSEYEQCETPPSGEFALNGL